MTRDRFDEIREITRNGGYPGPNEYRGCTVTPAEFEELCQAWLDIHSYRSAEVPQAAVLAALAKEKQP